MCEKLSDRSHVRRRILVEQRGCIGRKPIGSFSLGEKAMDGEIIAKDSDAFLCALTERRDRLRSGCSASDVGENFQIDGSLEGHGELIRGEGLMDASRVDRDWVDLDRVGL